MQIHLHLLYSDIAMIEPRFPTGGGYQAPHVHKRSVAMEKSPSTWNTARLGRTMIFAVFILTKSINCDTSLQHYLSTPLSLRCTPVSIRAFDFQTSLKNSSMTGISTERFRMPSYNQLL